MELALLGHALRPFARCGGRSCSERRFCRTYHRGTARRRHRPAALKGRTPGGPRTAAAYDRRYARRPTPPPPPLRTLGRAGRAVPVAGLPRLDLQQLRVLPGPPEAGQPDVDLADLRVQPR